MTMEDLIPNEVEVLKEIVKPCSEQVETILNELFVKYEW